MDSNKLKALKVVDLRAIFAKANVQVPAKATKSDLISRIQASKPAQDAYLALYPQDDLLAPPEDVDWNVDQPVVVPLPATKESKQPATKPTTPPPTVTPTDPELEKRRKRAERFGIPLIEPKKPTTSDAAEKLKERAARFGTKVQPDTPAPAPSNDKKNLKRSAPQADTVDPEELERRRKRAERFATTEKM
ncbi:hypothetical protein BYT27DRAFT_7180360 [Phlegmacium glaucopus]|nr:hypothetical protein BYT27DRAFT_7180360 [Phlegmacium glaucopus]